jgi:hypothetical protein
MIKGYDKVRRAFSGHEKIMKFNPGPKFGELVTKPDPKK